MSFITSILERIKNFITFLNKKGFFHLLTVNLFSQLLSFITLLVVAKLLTPTEYGDLKIIQTYVNIFIVVATFGFGSSVLKFFPKTVRKRTRSNIMDSHEKDRIIRSGHGHCCDRYDCSRPDHLVFIPVKMAYYLYRYHPN